MVPSIVLRAAAKATISTHVVISAISLLHGTYAKTLPPDEAEGWVRDKHAKLFAWLPQLDLMVVECYAGHGVEPRHLPPTSSPGNATNSTHTYSTTLVKLAKDATFEDAAAICRGPEEIAEAFRALRVARPEFVRHPHRISLEQCTGGAAAASPRCIVTYYMHQRYAGLLTVKSLLRITVDISGATGDKGKKDVSGGTSSVQVEKMEEQWNGVEPINLAPFRISRRINGMLSWWLTSLLVS